jgi:beta-glucosidase
MSSDHETEIKELLGRMTPMEKFGQLQQLAWGFNTGPGGPGTEDVETAARAGRVGSVLNLMGAGNANALQRIAVEESRLGIPLMYGLDVIHGYWTTFPIPLAQAAAFDPAVTETDGATSAREARSDGIHWVFSPMMDVTHEPRWGRIAESHGEDPYLTARYAAAKVRGYQGSTLDRPDRVAACAKHFAAYGGAEGGRDYNTVDVSEQRLRNLYLPPFLAAVDAGAATVMAAFNTVSGVPAHGNTHTLTDILKTQWSFDGVVVSDWAAVDELVTHGFAADRAEAGRLALTAGVDVEMASTSYVEHGPDLLTRGLISEERLDDAVTRVLRLKFRLGLFDRPYVDLDAVIAEPTPDARAAAREVAARCMVLLTNSSAVLPLDAAVSSVAVVGPFADSTDLLGTWVLGETQRRFPAGTIRQALEAALPSTRILHGDAVEAAQAADVTIVVVGEPSGLSGEAATRSDLGLPDGQEELIAAVAATGKPYAVVVLGGRPLTGAWLESAPAVLMAWHPGLEGGNAIADVLTGAVNPGGKLPVTFPRAVGQVPIYYNRENTGRPYDPAKPENPFVSAYLDLADGPRFPFGHGLSYTTFEVASPGLSRDHIEVAALRDGATVEVTVPVRNTGDRAGDEVVQLYIHDRAASIVQPVRRLRGFQRVHLAAGEETVVHFTLGADDLGFWTGDPAGRFVVEPGEIDLHTGTTSAATATRTLTVTQTR